MQNNEQIIEALLDIRTYLNYQKSLGNYYLPIEESCAMKTTKKPNQTKENKDKEGLLKNLRDQIGDCTLCRLSKERNNLVFGEGNPDSDLMFVGEGPGFEEDKQGRPFVGRAGQLLTKIIEAMGLKRTDVFIANVVKCLKYNSMVQLGNGKWERISKLVRQQYHGTVKSIDSNGKIVERKITGWHATALADRPVYKLSYKSARPTGPNKCAIHLTGDHPVLTEKRGYVTVQKIKNGDRIATGQGLSPTIKNIVVGTLLGDGHINAKQSLLSFSHSIKQKEYALFKASLLKKELGCTTYYTSVSAGSTKKYQIIKHDTKSKRSLRIIRKMFYSPHKRVPEYLSNALNPIILAIWFMDDGYMRIRPPRQPSAELATCAFNKRDLNILIKGLKRLGLKPHTIGNRIFFNVKETKKLSEIIAPYVPPCMRWKLHPEVIGKIPFNRTLYHQNETQEVLYDEVYVKRIKHTGADKTFFCIDVEETNNFVTTGGVVHNCRPPENRNPAPDEIGRCMPFLMKQIEIIEPKVIVGLGTFASQAILDTQEKISRMRGKLFDLRDFDGIKFIPTYHPAFLLRNSNMKRPVWDDMKKVMEILKS